MLRRIFYNVIQYVFLIICFALMFCLRSLYDVDLIKDLYLMISIVVVVLVLFFGLEFVSKTIFISVITLFVSTYLSSQHNYFLQNNSYYLFSFDNLFKYTSIMPIIVVAVVFVVAMLAYIFIRVKTKDIYVRKAPKLIIIGFIFLALIPMYLFKHNQNMAINAQKYNISEQPYYNYYYLDDTNKFVEDYGIFNLLYRDFEIQINSSKDNSDLINEIHDYYFNHEHKDNNYTGIFKDKNIIIIQSDALNLDNINQTKTPLINQMYTEGISTSNYYTPEFYNVNGDLDFMANTSLVPYGINKNTVYDCERHIFPETLPKLFINNNYITQYFFNDYLIYENKETIVLDTIGYNEFFDCTKLSGEERLNSYQVCDKVAGMFSYYNTVNRKYMAYVNMYSVDDINDLEEGINRIYETIINCGLKENYVIVLMSGYSEKESPIFTIYDCGDNKQNININNKPITCLDLMPTIANLFDFDYKYALGEDILNKEYNGFIFDIKNDENNIWYDSYAVYSANYRKILDTIDGSNVDEVKELEYFKDKAEMIRVSHLILDTNYFQEDK